MTTNVDDRICMKDATSNPSIDYLIMKSLNDIMNFESNTNINVRPKSPIAQNNVPFSNESDSDLSDPFKQYKQKVQYLLKLLLSKLEDNYSYQTYLESEIETLESAQKIDEENRFHRRRSSRFSDPFLEKENRRSLSELINIDNNKEEKELLNQKIALLERELGKCRDESEKLQQVRNEELVSMKAAINLMKERVATLNSNYVHNDCDNSDF